MSSHYYSWSTVGVLLTSPVSTTHGGREGGRIPNRVSLSGSLGPSSKGFTHLGPRVVTVPTWHRLSPWRTYGEVPRGTTGRRTSHQSINDGRWRAGVRVGVKNSTLVCLGPGRSVSVSFRHHTLRWEVRVTTWREYFFKNENENEVSKDNPTVSTTVLSNRYRRKRIMTKEWKWKCPHWSVPLNVRIETESGTLGTRTTYWVGRFVSSV